MMGSNDSLISKFLGDSIALVLRLNIKLTFTYLKIQQIFHSCYLQITDDFFQGRKDFNRGENGV